MWRFYQLFSENEMTNVQLTHSEIKIFYFLHPSQLPSQGCLSCFKAAGLWFFFVKGLRSDFPQQSKGCDLAIVANIYLEMEPAAINGRL